MALAKVSSRYLAFGNSIRILPRPEHYIFFIVLLVRLVVLTRLASSPFLLPRDSDMHFYDDWAKQILQGRFTEHLAFYGLPLYAYILALLYKLVGDNPFVPGLLQICLDAGTATLLYKIAVQAFRTNSDLKAVDRRACVIGVLAASCWAVFVPAQAYSVILMPTTLSVFLFWLLVWQVVRSDHSFTPLRSLIYGGLAGITAMANAAILFVVPLLVAAVLFKRKVDGTSRPAWASRVVGIASLFVGLAAGTSPCWIHNYFVARDPVLLSAHSGINFWLGNNPHATGYPHFPGLHTAQAAMLKDSVDLAETAAGRKLKRSEVSKFWSAKARAYITSDFGGWLNLLGKKLINFWNAFVYDDISVISKLDGSRVILPGLGFGLIAVLAIPGILVSISRFRTARWILAAILLNMVAVLSVFVTERYRIAAVPGLALFAVTGICTFWESCALRVRGATLYYLGLLTAAAFFVTWPQRDPELWALSFYNSGMQALERQQWKASQQKLEAAHAYAPNSTEINLALGNLWLEQQEFPRAQLYYLDILRVDSDHKAALRNLGLVAISERQWDVAVNYLHAALRADPGDATTHYLFARARFEGGHLEEALSEIQVALRLRPGQREFEELYDLILRRQ